MEENNQNLNPAPPVSPVLPTEQTPPTPPVSNIEKWKPKFPLSIIIGLILFLLILGSVVGFYFFKQQSPKQIACTMEAKLCSDGTSVGRTGPKCEFAPCPIAKNTPTPDTTATWKTYENNDFSFKYPSDWIIKVKDSYRVEFIKQSCISLECQYYLSVYWKTTRFNDVLDFIKDYYGQLLSSNFTSSNFKTADGLIFKKLPGQFDVFSDYFIINKNNGYIIRASMAGSDASSATALKFKNDSEELINSFRFTDQPLPPGGQYSSEGQSCGSNAGSAGNAQCAPGLTCKYKTPQEQSNGIGTCVKE